MSSPAPGTILLRGVHKSFRRYHAWSTKEAVIQLARGRPLVERRAVLRGLDLRIAKGERVGVVGRNGAGKSTLFRIISGILAPERGEVLVGGRVSPLIEITAGLVPDMNGSENIALNAMLLGATRAQLRERFRSMVEFAEIADFLGTPARYYSSGMQARLGFSVAVHVDADILLIDEVLAVGDVAFQDRCMARMQELADQGITLVFVSHDLAAIRRVCTRAIWLEEGVVRADGHPEEVTERFALHLAEAG